MNHGQPQLHRLRGEMGSHFDRVWLDGHELSPKRSQRLINHSPDGFAWGYGGSGPAQLALAVLYEATHDKDYAIHNHQHFKRSTIAPLEFGKDFEIAFELPLKEDAP